MKRSRVSLQRFMVLVFALVISFSLLSPASAAINDSVVIKTVKELRDAGVPLPGGTFIENGEALHDDDLIMFNGKIAISVSVGTPNPWGYPPSSILDAALMIDNSAAVPGSPSDSLLDKVKRGSLKAGKDTIWDMEFLMDNWDSWGPENSKPRVIFVSEDVDFDGDGIGDGERGIVSVRKFGHPGKMPMDVYTVYVLGNDDNFLRINTIVKNPSIGDTYGPLSTGYSLGNKGAFMFAPHESVGYPYNKYVNTYNKDYSVSLIDLNCEVADIWGSSGYKDTERKTTYEPGKDYHFEAIFRIDGEGSLEGTLNQLMDEVDAERVQVNGEVYDTDTSEPIANPIIVVEKGGRTFTWIIGQEDGTFSFNLPKIGDMSQYQVYALKELYSPGEKVDITLNDIVYEAGSLGLSPTKEVTVTVKDEQGNPVDARLELLGVTTPAVRYVAQTVFYSDLDNVGVAKVPVSQGDYSIQVSSGVNFVTLPVTLTGNTNAGTMADVTITNLANPASYGWYSGDLHHHSDKSDGSTKPIDLIKSQLAARLDLIFSSDHDSVASNPEIAGYAVQRNFPYLPSIEVSPSWAHFNILPWTTEAYNNLKNGTFFIDPYMDFPAMVKLAHDSGALVMANHPYISYGLFTAQEAGTIPGGYSPDFSFIEINGGVRATANQKALDKAMDFWTSSLDGSTKSYYLVGGSDVHDVLVPGAFVSGNVRTFAKVEGELTPQKYMEALVKGNTYVSAGPLLFPANRQFGEEYIVVDGDAFTIELDAMAVNGLSSVAIFSQGQKVAEQVYSSSTERNSVSFTFNPNEDTWYSVVATDSTGKSAYSNPIWVKVAKEYVPSPTVKPGTFVKLPPAVDGVVVMPGIDTKVVTPLGDVKITIPEGLRITRPDGGPLTYIQLPALLDNGAASVSNGTVNAVIEVGLPGIQITFDRAVKLVIPGMAGKAAAYSHGGQTYKITRTLAENTQEAADRDIPEAGEAVTTEGDDLVIWTKHFTQFIAYTPNPTSGGGGGGGGGGGSTSPGNQTPQDPTNPQNPVTPETLKDIKGHWAQTRIQKLVDLGAIKGYPDNTFRPDNNITRAEFAVVLVKAFNLEAKEGGKVFTDTAGHWAKDDISIAVANGIAKGYNENNFGPNDLITREQMAVMIAQAAKLGTVSNANSFTDGSKIAPWAKEAVDAAAAKDIIKGYPDKSFKPQNNATRAEAVTVIVNSLD